MALIDWEQTILGQPLTIPVRGKTYPVPELGWLGAQQLREEFARIADQRRLIEDEARAAKGEERQLDDAERKRIMADPPKLDDEGYLRLLLGGSLAQMRADDVPPSAILHAARCAHTDALKGRDAAEKLWNEGPDPEAVAAEKAALASLITSLSTPRPARSSSMKRPASTASTNSPRSRASRSAGTRSSKPRRS